MMHTCGLLILWTATLGADQPPPTWSDQLLAFPYGSLEPSDRPTLVVLRQDHEQLEVNRNILRGPLVIGKQRFERGIGTHAVSHLQVSSPQPIQRFSAKIGVDNNQVTNPGRPIGTVAFVVEANGRTLYRSGILKAGEEAQAVSIDTGGARILDLRVEDGGDGTPCDWADWVDARITLAPDTVAPLHEMKVVSGALGARYPFSFVYDGRASDELLKDWKNERQSRQLDADRESRVAVWTEPRTGLRLRVEMVRYADFPAVEWVLWFENMGSSDTRILEDVQALDLTFGTPLVGAGPYRLRVTKGSAANPSDFEVSTVVIDSKSPAELSGGSGKSSARHFPFFKIETRQASAIIAVGWSGQWAARFRCPDGKRLRAQAGLERTHFLLHPGERVRSPRILVLNWEGNPAESNAAFRRLIYKHYAARRNGAAPLPIAFCNTCFTRGGVWLNECNAENQISLIRAYGKLGLEALLTDAGWFEGGWPSGAGNWTPRKDAYPQGMAPVARAAQEQGMIYGLWFEPERVIAGTTLHREHPDWLLTDGRPGQKTLLADFGRREVQDYFFNIVRGFMDLPGFRVYRQDFNMYPLEWWRHHDAPDRQGITEMKYIEGLYSFWDRLAETWPDSLREECASGGMRIDLETVKRMHIHQKTDYWFDDDADQAHLFGLSQYLPNNVVAAHLNRLDDYSFHSTMASSLCLGWIADGPDFNTPRGRELLQRYLAVRHLLVGDWYPLVPYTNRATEWMAAQFHRRDLDEGLILAFRRPSSPYPVAQVALVGLDPQARYALEEQGSPTTPQIIKGEELAKSFRLELAEPHSSKLIVYRRRK